MWTGTTQAWAHEIISFFKINICSFYLWLHWVFVALHGPSPGEARGATFQLRCMGFSSWWFLLLWSTGSRHVQASVALAPRLQIQAQQLWYKDLVAPQHVESPWIKDQTHAPCSGRWIVYHLATREARAHFFWLEQRDHGKNLGRNFWMFFGGAQLLSDMKPLQIQLEDLFITRSGNTSVPNPTTKTEELRVLSYQL